MSRTKQTLATHKIWIEACLDNYHRLTKWEDDFIHSIQEQLELHGSLSEKQEEILERIFADRTP